MRHLSTCLVGVLGVLLGCSADGGKSPEDVATPPGAAQSGEAQPRAGESNADKAARGGDAPAAPAEPVARGPKHQPELAPKDRVLVVFEGEERYIDRKTAVELGYTLVSLRNNWTPYIFDKVHTAEGELLPNRYRRLFIGLANDEIDGDGIPLPEDEYNFLEVFGIPPAIGVLRARMLADDQKACHKEIDYALIGKVSAMTYRSDAKERSHRRWMAATAKKLEEAQTEAGAADLNELAEKQPKLAKDIEKLQEAQLQRDVLAEIDKRLDCDEHNHKRYRHKKGEMDQGLRLAIRRFQRKHKIYEHTNLKGETMKILAQPPLQSNYDDFVRALTEHVVSAASILEDGTQHLKKKKSTYVGADGETHEVRNLVKEFTDSALQQLNLDAPEKLLAFFKRHPAEEFEHLIVGVKFPAYPEYYSPHMDLFIKISRGTVWYDPPFNDEGKRIYQHRSAMPKFAVYTRYRDQEIRLARWGTTIGGWREELAPNGHLYLKYKGSDIGDRVIRNINAGPTWVPPTSTPLKSLAKRRWVNGQGQGVVNYNEMGPGYLSAYGLVAGYFVRPRGEGKRDIDNGIRAHGSSDYMSILSHERYSHGCHRLMNHLAVRLYGFILNHRIHVVNGDQTLTMNRTFLHDGGVYQIRVPSRGFQYELTPPIDVSVSRGSIRGRRKTPPKGFVEIPGRSYPRKKPGEDPDAPVDTKAGIQAPSDALANIPVERPAPSLAPVAPVRAQEAP